jgi:polyhydroxyalkanoate synthesis regulator phasin
VQKDERSKTMKVNRKLVAGAAAGLAVAGGGAAIAATQFGDPRQESQAIINDAAQRLGVRPDALSDALKQALMNRVDAAVQAGRLTKEQGEQIKDRIKSGDVPLFFFGGGPPRLHFEGPVRGLDAAASYLGLTESELQSKLAQGKTLAQIAKDEGKSVDGLVQALVEDAKKHLDEAVSQGRLTREQEQSILANLKEHVTALVNGQAPQGFPGRGGPGFGGAVRGLDAAASYLGLTRSELQSKLAQGKTLAQIAKDEGKSVDGLVQALVDDAKKHLDEAVSQGRLTQEQEQSILTKIKEGTALVNGQLPQFRGPGGPGFGFDRPGFGFGGPGSGFSGPWGPPASGQQSSAGAGWGTNA